jgi:hypothetical protein
MLVKYNHTKKVVLTMLRDSTKRAVVLSPVKKKYPTTIDLDPEDKEAVTHPFLSQDGVGV